MSTGKAFAIATAMNKKKARSNLLTAAGVTGVKRVPKTKRVTSPSKLRGATTESAITIKDEEETAPVAPASDATELAALHADTETVSRERKPTFVVSSHSKLLSTAAARPTPEQHRAPKAEYRHAARLDFLSELVGTDVVDGLSQRVKKAIASGAHRLSTMEKEKLSWLAEEAARSQDVNFARLGRDTVFAKLVRQSVNRQRSARQDGKGGI